MKILGISGITDAATLEFLSKMLAAFVIFAARARI
jgi:hypothetical protein